MFLLGNTCDIANHTDGNTPYTSSVSDGLVLNKLENSRSDLWKRFRENGIRTITPEENCPW